MHKQTKNVLNTPQTVHTLGVTPQSIQSGGFGSYNPKFSKTFTFL